MKNFKIYHSINTKKFIIILLINIIILIKFSISTFNAHGIFASIAVNLKKKNFNPPFVHCSCHKRDDLSKMMAVKFIDGNKYLISEEPIGEGGTALVFHGIYIGKKWELPAVRPIKCEAIKVANPSNIKNKNKNNEEIVKELAIIDDIFKQPKEYSIWPPADHNLRFFRKEIFLYKNVKYSAIVMELGKQNLYEYWQEAMPQFCRCQSFSLVQFCQPCTYDRVSEKMLLYIMREISLGLEQLHQRNYIFVDLKPQNVMIMPNSPNPKELCEENHGKIRLKLTDFGAAQKFVPENGKLILSDDEWLKLMGTPFYHAPELYLPNFINVISPGTDIFSLGRLMLMLAVQTPQMKKFIPQIKQFWEDMDHKRNSEETHINWIILLDEMLRVARIHPTIILPSNVEEFSESENEIFDHESQRSNLEEISDHENEYEMSDDESWNLEKIYNKILEREKKQKEEEKRKKEIEERNEFLKTLFEELKMNYGHLMKIIEQTQATDQEKRPSISTIIKECSQKLVHLGRIQTERKMHKNSTARKLFFSEVLTTGSSERTDSSGSSSSKGSSSKSSKRSRRWSMDNIRF